MLTELPAGALVARSDLAEVHRVPAVRLYPLVWLAEVLKQSNQERRRYVYFVVDADSREIAELAAFGCFGQERCGCQEFRPSLNDNRLRRLTSGDDHFVPSHGWSSGPTSADAELSSDGWPDDARYAERTSLIVRGSPGESIRQNSQPLFENWVRWSEAAEGVR